MKEEDWDLYREDGDFRVDGRVIFGMNWFKDVILDYKIWIKGF